MIVLTLLSGMLLLMLQLMLVDFLALVRLARLESESLSHPTQVFPDIYEWSTSFGATNQ